MIPSITQTSRDLPATQRTPMPRHVKPRTGGSHGPGPGQDRAPWLQQLSCFPPPGLAQEDRGSETGMLELQVGLGRRWERTALACACTGPTAVAQSTTMLHVQVPVLDVELLHLKRQASGMSLKPREGELATEPVQKLGEHARGLGADRLQTG